MPKSLLLTLGKLFSIRFGWVPSASTLFIVSSEALEWQDDVSANCVHEDEVEEDDNTETIGSFDTLYEVQGVMLRLSDTLEHSRDPADFSVDMVQ